MDSLFLLLFFISLIALVIGMIKPKLVLRFIDNEKRNRKNVFKIYGLILIFSFILFGITTPNTEDDDIVDNNQLKEIDQKELKEELRKEVRQEIKEELREEVRQEVREEVKKELKKELKEGKKAITTSVLSEKEYKEKCIDIPWKEVVKDRKTYVGTYLKKDLMVRGFTEDTLTEERVYVCGEKKEGGSYAGGTFYIYDNRKDQTQSIELYDKIYVYGQIEGIYMSFKSYEPRLEVEYVEFNGKFGD